MIGVIEFCDLTGRYLKDRALAFSPPKSGPIANRKSREFANYYRQRIDQERVKAGGATDPQKKRFHLVLAEIFAERVIAAE